MYVEHTTQRGGGKIDEEGSVTVLLQYWLSKTFELHHKKNCVCDFLPGPTSRLYSHKIWL